MTARIRPPRFGLAAALRPLVGAAILIAAPDVAAPQSSARDRPHPHPFVARQAAERLLPIAAETEDPLLALAALLALKKVDGTIRADFHPITADLLRLVTEAAAADPALSHLMGRLDGVARAPSKSCSFQVRSGETVVFALPFKAGVEAVVSVGLVAAASANADIDITVVDQRESEVARSHDPTFGVVGLSDLAHWTTDHAGRYAVRLANVGTGDAEGELSYTPAEFDPEPCRQLTGQGGLK